MSQFVSGVTQVPVMADTIVVHNENLDCKGVDFGGRNVIFENDIYGNHKKLEYLKNGYVQNKSLNYTFSGDSHLTTFDLDCSNLQSANSMFNNCSALKDVNTHSMSALTTASRMFYGCSGLTDVVIGNLDSITSAGIVSMFSNCSSLSSLTFGNLPNVNRFSGVIANCPELVDVKFGDLPSITSTQDLTVWLSIGDASFVPAVENFTIGNMSNLVYMSALFSSAEYTGTLKTFKIGDCPMLKSVYCFLNQKNVESIEFGTVPDSGLNISFAECSNLKDISFANDKVYIVGGEKVFRNCKSLNANFFEKVDFSSYSGDLSYGFCNTQITEIPNISGENISSLSWAFAGCNNLKTARIGNIPNAGYNNFNNVFSDCVSLTDAEIYEDKDHINSNGNLDDGFFSGCSSLSSVTLESYLDNGTSISMYSNVFNGTVLSELNINGTNCGDLDSLLQDVTGTFKTLRSKQNAFSVCSNPNYVLSIPTVEIKDWCNADVESYLKADSFIIDNVSSSAVTIQARTGGTRTIGIGSASCEFNLSISGESTSTKTPVILSGNGFNHCASANVYQIQAPTIPIVLGGVNMLRVQYSNINSLIVSSSAETLLIGFYGGSATTFTINSSTVTGLTPVTHLKLTCNTLTLNTPNLQILNTDIAMSSLKSISFLAMPAFSSNKDPFGSTYTIESVSIKKFNLNGGLCQLSGFTYVSNIKDVILTAIDNSEGDSGTIYVSTNMLNKFTSDEIASSLAKGYTITT